MYSAVVASPAFSGRPFCVLSTLKKNVVRSSAGRALATPSSLSNAPLRHCAQARPVIAARQRPELLQRRSWRERSFRRPDNLLRVQAAALGAGSSSSDGVSPGSSSDSESLEDGQTVEIDLDLPRRSRLVAFTCNICTGRSERLVNPVAWDRGMVIVQCQHCQAWHKVADAANLVEEIRYADLENSDLE